MANMGSRHFYPCVASVADLAIFGTSEMLENTVAILNENLNKDFLPQLAW